MSEATVVAAMIAAAGGRVEIPIGVYEQIPLYPGIKTWLAYGEHGPRYVWALEEPALQEIQEREEEAYEAWLADRRRDDVELAVNEVQTTWMPPELERNVDPTFLAGYRLALSQVLHTVGVGTLTALPPATDDETFPITEPGVPEAWCHP